MHPGRFERFRNVQPLDLRFHIIAGVTGHLLGEPSVLVRIVLVLPVSKLTRSIRLNAADPHSGYLCIFDVFFIHLDQPSSVVRKQYVTVCVVLLIFLQFVLECLPVGNQTVIQLVDVG